MKKVPVWKNIVLIVSVLVMIIIATFAWFYLGTSGEVLDLSVDVNEAAFVQISGDNGEHWSSELNMEVGINKNLKELSGDGLRFFTPVYDVVEQPSGGYQPEIIAFEEAQDKARYIEQTFMFRSDSAYDLYLSPESCITSVIGEDSNIVGAIRVAFLELDENDNEILKCIWAPNSTVEFSPETNAFVGNGEAEDYYYYQISETPVDIGSLTDDVIDANVVRIPAADPDAPEEGHDCGYNEDYRFMWSCGETLPENAPILLSLRTAEGEAMATKRMVVRVWLEGHDRECVSQLTGEKFTMKFQFKAEKESNDE